MNTRARWITDVPDMYSALATANTFLTVAEVSRLTGFSPNTITDLLSREPITAPSNPQGPLSRPAARIGVNPLYSTAQVEEVLRRRGNLQDRQKLTKFSVAEAAELDLVSMVEIAELARVHEQTVRKWSSRSDAFPRPVGERERDAESPSGVPFVVYERRAVVAWLAQREQDKGTTRTRRRTKTGVKRANVTV